jgi:hypothetical protein
MGRNKASHELLFVRTQPLSNQKISLYENCNLNRTSAEHGGTINQVVQQPPENGGYIPQSFLEIGPGKSCSRDTYS